MCGISGYLAFKGAGSETDTLRLMSRAVKHRGPDGEGAVFIHGVTGAVSEFAGERTAMMPADLPPWPEGRGVAHDVAMAHRRFAIVDRTPAAHQPFILKTGLGSAPVVLTFNGEVYNHIELREELAQLGHAFSTRSDVEVLARAYLQWGEGCFARLRGFWSIALWDGRRASRGLGALLLARDPIGKAPLYFTRRAGRLWWSSEIKGLLAAFSGASGLNAGSFPVREEAVAQFVRAGLRDFGNKTFYEGIETFPRASWAWVDATGSFEPKAYWDFPRQRLTTAEIGTREAIAGLSERLESAVQLRLRADTKVGLELSGGMDSSAIAALAALSREGRENMDPLSAYTVRFPDPWNEAPFARLVAERYPRSLRLTELAPENASVLRAIGPFQRHMDEPFHSPNMVAGADIWRRMAGEGIRVSLNGAGGDEVFAGYGGEYLGPFARGLLAQGRLLRAFRELGSFSEREASLLRSSARALWWMVPEAARRSLRPAGPPAELDPLRTRETMPAASDNFEQRLLDHLTDHKMNYWLRSGNTSFMAVPMEVRLPLLDARVVEWACRLPAEYLIRDGWMKWVLRKALEPHLPREVVWRRVKMGFPFPLREWLQASKPGLQVLRTGADLPFLDRRRLFEAYDALADRYPAYLWRCLSVLLWWENCVQERAVNLEEGGGAAVDEAWTAKLLVV